MKILLVADHPMVLEVMGAIARSVFKDADVRLARNLADALALGHEARDADLVLLDLGLPGCSGIEALVAFHKAFPLTRVLVVSATEDRDSVMQALEAGAVGYVPKTHAPPLIAAALRVVAEGGTYVPPQALREVESATHRLTKRQLAVLRLIVKGLGNREIAKRLRIAKDTVKQHAKVVYAVLGVASRSEAARAAARRGIKLD